MKALTWTCLALVASMMTAVPVSAQKPSMGAAEVGGCTSSGSATLGTFFRTCVSSFGTVDNITAASAISNISTEGYAICAGTTKAVALSFVDVGFEAPTTATQTSNTRTTTDGRFRLTQTFTRDALEKELVITMTVRNLTAAAIPSVRVARFFDGDIGGTELGDSYAATNRGIFAHESYSYPGVSLESRTLNVTAQTDIEAYNTFDPLTSGCLATDAIWPVTPSAEGDWVGWVTYFLGTINAGASKIVKFVYRIM